MSGNGQAFYIQFGVLPELPESSHPCLNKSINLFDAYRPFDIAPSAVGGPFANDDLHTSVPIGSVFTARFRQRSLTCLSGLPAVQGEQWEGAL